MRMARVLAIVLACCSAGCPLLFAAEAASVVKARPFALEQVTLLDSPFKKAMEINRAYLLKLDPDRFLWPFHERAGMPVKGERYGGWEQKDIVGQTTGHYLTACSLMFSASAATT